jgi:hypothetical protein
VPSTFTWLDHSDTERRRVLEAIDQLEESDGGAPHRSRAGGFRPSADPVEKRKLLVRTCATPWGLLACARLADIEPDPSLRARRLAVVCVAGLEDRCAQLAELDPSPSSRRALLLAASEQMGPDCAIHPINHALAAAKVPPEPADAGGGPR